MPGQLAACEAEMARIPTGCFYAADEHRRESGKIENGLLTTIIACGPSMGEVSNYALEGAVFMAASAQMGCAMK